MYKLDYERQRNQRSNCQRSLDHGKSREFQKMIYFCFIHYAKAFDCGGHRNCGKFLRDGYTGPLYLAPEKPVCRSRGNRIRQEQWSCSELVTEYVKAVLLSRHLFNLHVQYIMQNVRLDEAQTGIEIAGRNINKLRHADDRKHTRD